MRRLGSFLWCTFSENHSRFVVQLEALKIVPLISCDKHVDLRHKHCSVLLSSFFL